MLAERIGCSQQYLDKILKGSENLSLDVLCKVEEGVSPTFTTNVTI